MSSIFGFCINNDSDNPNKNDITKMLVWNRIYGTCCEDISIHNMFSMGCCVESIEEKHIQNQPVLREKHCHAVIDAIIYNREEFIYKYQLSEDLSDAELLFKLINRLGLESLKDINGDFSGAIFDEKNNKLFLFRDHMGIRPLFYYKNDNKVAFSTDLRGLIALSFVDAQIDENWIYKTISGFDADTLDNTPYNKIFCVTPASYITFSFTKTTIICTHKRYWKLGHQKIKLSSELEYAMHLRELITDSVMRRLEAVSGKIGAELSGGLDSGVIGILINRTGRDCIYYSWSIDPKEVEYADKDERLIINDICKQEKITCYFEHLSEDIKPGITKIMAQAGIKLPSDGSSDFRFAFPPYINTYSIIRGAQFVKSKGANVMFTGHGGDEGVSHRSSIYEMFHTHEFYHYWKYIWSVTNKRGRIRRTIKKGIVNITRSIKAFKAPYIGPFASPELLKESFSKKYKKQKQARLQFDYDPIAYINNGGSRNRLDNLAMLGAYTGIRYMVPYLDYRVIDYAVSIPRHLYINGKTKRYIFRQAFKDIMPDSLYRLDNKEMNSITNISTNENWHTIFIERKEEIISNLDKKIWSQYLNFDIIDALAQKDKFSAEEFDTADKQLTVLLKCALAQNIIDRTKQE